MWLDDGLSMSDERYIALKVTTRRERGGMLIEAMVAVIVLTIAFLAWAGSMMGASQGQYHAAKHTQSIEIANYLLEQQRRDSFFWGPTEYTPSCGTAACWTKNVSGATDFCNVPWPAYNDAGSDSGPWHPGCQYLADPSGIQPQINQPYQYQWRADVHGFGLASQDTLTADITVWVRTQTLHGGWDTYKVTAIRWEPQP
jgi:type II secretory pathway pseudopilin PulG